MWLYVMKSSERADPRFECLSCEEEVSPMTQEDADIGELPAT